MDPAAPSAPAPTPADGQSLVDALCTFGVRYLTGASDEPADGPMDPLSLITGLASSPEPLLRNTLVALFLTHPELASVAQRAADSLAPRARDALIGAYIGAVYLQRLWRTRLRRFFGDQPSLPPIWIDKLGLPPPDAHFGRLGLAALDARRRGATRFRSGRTEFEQVAHHLFGQLLTERAAATPAAA